MKEVEEDILTAILERTSAERRMRGLPAEERVRGMSLEELARTLNAEQAAQLRELLEKKRGEKS